VRVMDNDLTNFVFGGGAEGCRCIRDRAKNENGHVPWGFGFRVDWGFVGLDLAERLANRTKICDEAAPTHFFFAASWAVLRTSSRRFSIVPARRSQASGLCSLDHAYLD
jgi:hypothetical protein